MPLPEKDPEYLLWLREVDVLFKGAGYSYGLVVAPEQYKAFVNGWTPKQYVCDVCTDWAVLQQYATPVQMWEAIVYGDLKPTPVQRAYAELESSIPDGK